MYALFSCCYRCSVIIMPLLAFALMSQCAPSYANDPAVYECKSELANLFGPAIAGNDADLASAMDTLTPHNIYIFDFINKTVSFRLLNNKGKDFGLLGIGQIAKYTAGIELDGNKISWNNVISDSNEGSISTHDTFDLKSGKLSSVTTIKTSNRRAPPSHRRGTNLCPLFPQDKLRHDIPNPTGERDELPEWLSMLTGMPANMSRRAVGTLLPSVRSHSLD